MSAATPVADMCPGTGELSAALQATIHADCRDQDIPAPAAVTIGAPARTSRTPDVVARHAALMPTRGLEQLDAIDRKELS